jgi:signal transduction histidine kinase
MLSQVEPGEFLVPSPLLQATDPLLRLYFERGPDGALRSPQVPMGPMRTLAESTYVTGYAVVSSEQLLTQLDDLLTPTHRKLAADVVELRAEKDIKDQRLYGYDDAEQMANKPAEQPQPQPAPTQSLSAQSGQYSQQLKQSADEYQSRMSNAQQAQVQPAPQYARGLPQPAAPTPASPPVPGAAAKTEVADAAKSGAAPPASIAAPAPPAPAPKPGDALKKADADKPDVDNLAKNPDADKRYRNAEDPAWKEAEKAAGESKAFKRAGSRLDDAQKDPYAMGEPESTGLATPLLVGALEPGVVQGQFSAAWVLGPKPGESELVYTREVDAGDTHLTQGFWVDWESLRDSLLADTKDLVPGATLRPLLSAPDPADQAVLGRTLAALPAVLEAPLPKMPAMPVWSPVRSTLLATWIAALGAMIAIALVLRASMELAERRGRFVSAVTHELRTPLTTFCLYSQMLADGMVKGEEDRQTYVKTLSSESQRLARIVESVLEYARLGRRQGSGKSLALVSELVEKIVPELRQRCEQAGMELLVENTADPKAQVLADAATLDRVLFNLVDNACKYASGSDDKRVHLVVETSGRELFLSVKDHGPGLERQEQRRVFRPFIRGQRQIDGSIPGLGLGLALSQGLAKELRGDLRIMPTESGAEFRLRVPLS